MRRLHAEDKRLAVVGRLLGVFLIVFVSILSVHARPRSVQAAQWEIADPRVPSIESNPVDATPIPPQSAEVGRIEAPAAVQTPKLSAPPIAPAGSMLPMNARSKQIESELLQLQRIASPSSGYGTTTASADAAWKLGLIHLHGAGVRIDRQLAQQWFERSARQGREPWAFAGLTWCSIDGCTTPPNPAAATRAINRLRSSHPARADFLAWLQLTRLNPLQISDPRSTDNTQSPNQGRALLERAAAGDDVQANIELGIMAFADKQVPQAERYFSRVASRSTTAAENLASLRDAGPGHSPSGNQASAPEGSAQAALNMARMYHRGQGVPVNYTEAVRFYRLAEQRGSSEAHKMLELIYSSPTAPGRIDIPWMQNLAKADLSQPVSLIAAGITATHQLRREPSPLFDLMPNIWQKRVLQLAQ